jgi:autotransporter-associated beta strand protein
MFVVSPVVSSAQQLAFPGAQGFGQYATGGRGGTVYHVTTLADSGTGSFRDAVSGANRTIVFDVGGYIVLNSVVACANNLTIAGQTAPGGGIGIMGHEVSFSSRNNEIVRFLRIRPGSIASSTEDGINCGNGVNMIFDHVSIEFSPYNNIDSTGNSGANTITLQNSILGDPIGQQFNQHAEAGGKTFAWCYNIFMNGHNRNPMAKVNAVYINNVVYNYQGGYTVADTSSHFTQDIVNNYFITGPSTTSAGDDFYQMDGNIQAYSSGNLLDQNRDGNLNGGNTAPGSVVVLSAPWSSVTTNTPTYPTVTAYKYDVTMAGALPHDQVDQNVIGNVTSLGKAGRIFASQTDTGLGNNGYGTIDGGTALTDTDGDGMPDIWEAATGSNPNNAADGNTVAADGYTLLEHYLNWLAAPHAIVQTNATDIDLWPYTMGFTNGATYTVFNFTNCTATITNSHFAHVQPTLSAAGLASFSFKVVDSAGSTMTNTMGLLVNVVYIPQNLVWVGNNTSNPWDTTNTADWFNGNNAVTFHTTDNVTFDDTGSTSPAINLAATVTPGNMALNSSQNYTFSGAGGIAGTGSLTVSGTNTTTINTANSYSGGTTINNATVAISSSSGLGTGPITLNGGTINQSGGSGFGNTITNLGNSTLNFNYNHTIYATLTAVGGGTLNVNSTGGGVFTPGGNMNGFAGVVNVNCAMRTSTTTGATTFGGSNSVWNFGNAGGIYTSSGNQTATFGALVGAAGSSLSGGGSLASTFVVGTLNTNSTFGGVIRDGGSAPGSLTKVGTGTLTLSGNSTHTGVTTVSNGTLLVTGNLSNSPVKVVSGATLQGTGFLGGGVTNLSGGIISPGLGNGSFGTMTISNNLTLATPTLDFDLSSSPTGTNDQIKMQSGTLAMSGAQTYNFNLVSNVLGAGTYNLITGAAGNTVSGVSFVTNLPAVTRQKFLMQQSSGSVQLIVTGTAASLLWSGTNGSAWDLAMTTNWLNGSAADKFYNLDTVTFNDSSTNGTVTVAPFTGTIQPAFLIVSNNTLPYSIGGGGIAGLTTIVKYGPGSLTLSPYEVSTTTSINNGSTTVTVASTNGIAPGLTLSGPHIPGNTVVVSVPNSTNVVISQAAQASSTYTISFCAVNSFTGGTVVNGGTLQLVNNPYGGGLGPIALNGGTLYLNGIGTGTTITCAGTNTLQTYGQPNTGFGLTGSGVLTLNIGGGGVFSPFGDWSGFSGTINFTTGNWMRELNTTSFGSSNAVWNLGSNGGIYNRDGAATIYLGALFGGVNAVLAAGQSGTPVTTYVIGGINTNSVFNGTISDGGLGTALIFNGPGSLTLTASNNFSGNTAVNSGTLIVNNTAGSGTGSGVVTVGPGATLAGTGAIGGIVSVAPGGILAPGNSSPGLLTLNSDLSLDNASVLQFQLGVNSDQIFVGGDLTLGGTLNISDAGGFGPGTYTLFNYVGALSVGTLTLGTTPADYTYTIDTSVLGQVNLIVSQPQIGNISVTPSGLVMSGFGGNTSSNFYLLSATNLALPLASWTRVLTNQFDTNGDFNFTNAMDTNAPQKFYILQLQ